MAITLQPTKTFVAALMNRGIEGIVYHVVMTVEESCQFLNRVNTNVIAKERYQRTFNPKNAQTLADNLSKGEWCFPSLSCEIDKVAIKGNQITLSETEVADLLDGQTRHGSFLIVRHEPDLAKNEIGVDFYIKKDVETSRRRFLTLNRNTACEKGLKSYFEAGPIYDRTRNLFENSEVFNEQTISIEKVLQKSHHWFAYQSFYNGIRHVAAIAESFNQSYTGFVDDMNYVHSSLLAYKDDNALIFESPVCFEQFHLALSRLIKAYPNNWKTIFEKGLQKMKLNKNNPDLQGSFIIENGIVTGKYSSRACNYVMWMWNMKLHTKSFTQLAKSYQIHNSKAIVDIPLWVS